MSNGSIFCIRNHGDNSVNITNENLPLPLKNDKCDNKTSGHRVSYQAAQQQLHSSK